MLEVWNRQLSPRPANMLLSEELESHEKLTWHPWGKSNDWPPDRHWSVSSRFTFYKHPCHHSCAATEFDDTQGHLVGTPFGCCLSACILFSWYSLETFLASCSWQ